MSLYGAVKPYLHQPAAAIHQSGHEQLNRHVDLRGLPLPSVWHSHKLWQRRWRLPWPIQWVVNGELALSDSTALCCLSGPPATGNQNVLQGPYIVAWAEHVTPAAACKS